MATMLCFDNGTKVSHSEDSKSLERYYSRFLKGQVEIPGLNVRIWNSDIEIEGISQRPASTLKILKGK